MSKKIDDALSGYTNERSILEAQEQKTQILAEIAGEEYTPEPIPKSGYTVSKRMRESMQKENEFLEAIADGAGTISGANKLAIDYATDVLSLKKGNTPIANSGVTLPAYGLSYDSSTGGLTLTKNGSGMQGQTVSIPDYGSPLTASSTSEMTDTDKVYVNTTDGKWYYYDGDSWEIGGTYNSQGIDTDTTLLVSGAPADAKAAGDAVTELKTHLTRSLLTEETATFVQSKYITTNGANGTVVDVEHPTSNTAFSYAIVKCRKGDVFTISGSGGSASRLWCFTDNDYKIISKSNANVSASNLKLTADSDGYFIQNSSKNSNPSLKHDFYYENVPTTLNQLTADVARLDGEIDAVSNALAWSNTIDFSKETEYNYIIATSNVWSGTGERWCYILPVPENTVFVDVTANSTHGARYALLKTGKPIHNTTPDFCTGYENVYSITSNTTEHILLPTDCKYVYIQKSYEDAVYTPSSVIFNGVYNIGEIDEQVDKLKSIAAIPSQIFNIDLKDADGYGDVSVYDDTCISADGYIPDTGWENRVVINKYVVCDDIKYRANISLATAGTGVCVIGTQSLAGSASDHATLVKFDFENAIVSFLTGSDEAGGGNIDGKSIPAYTYDSFALENLSGTEYRIEIGRTKRCPYAKVYNLTTGVLCGEKLLEVYDTSSSYGGKAGVMYDLPNFGVLSGTITFKRVSASVPTGVFAVFIGDSITEGSQVSWADTWANKSIMYLGSGVNCGRGSGSISHALRCASDILPAVKPKYVIVTIGTNGTPTKAQFANLIALIRKVNAIPIINRIPMNNRSGSGATAAVNAIVSTLGLDGASFDVATAVNNDPSQGQNTALFNSDRLHPNAAGGTAMYNQFLADLGWIKPDDWE